MNKHYGAIKRDVQEIMGNLSLEEIVGKPGVSKVFADICLLIDKSVAQDAN